MDEKQLLNYILTKQFLKTDEEIAELLYDSDGVLKENAGDLILDLNSKKIAKLKEEQQAYFDKGDTKGFARMAKKIEKAINERFGVEGETWEDMLEKIAEAKGGTSTKLTADDIKKHPVYLELESNSIPKQKYEELEGSFNEYKNGQQRAMTIGRVRDLAWQKTLQLNPVESENPKIAQTRREDFLSRFNGYDYEFNGDSVLILKGGTRLEDAHGNAVKFDAFVNDLASNYYEFKKQEDRGNAGNEKGGAGGSVPTTPKEYMAAIQNAKTTEERVAIKAAWEQAQKR